MMMKRTGPRLGPDEPSPMSQNPAQIQQAAASNMHTLAQSAQPQMLGATTMLSVGSAFGRGPPRPAGPQVINYLKANTVQYAPPKQTQVPPRLKLVSQPSSMSIGGRQSPGVAGVQVAPGAGASFQRLKVEDALSYLDQVKYKFNTQPQVYNDFLDIMKEFKSQTIDTPGVITRVSNLFKGHPELIVGFNTFLPPGYKIEVQSNGQVSVSMPSPTGMGVGVVPVGPVGNVTNVPPGPHTPHGPVATSGTVLLGVHHAQTQPQLVHLLPVQQSVSQVVHNLSVAPSAANTLHHISQAHQQIEAAAIHHTTGGPTNASVHSAAGQQPVEFNHAIEYVNKIKSRFSRQPDKYKRFLEILHAYQRGHRDVKEPQAKQQTEQEVYSQVAKLFENQEDLLAEFGQFLPDAKAVTKPPHCPPHNRTPPPPSRVDPEPERFVNTAAASPPLPPHAMHIQQIQKHTSTSNVVAPPPQLHHLKRSPSFSSSTPLGITASGPPPPKKPRSSGSGSAPPSTPPTSLRDVSYAEAAKVATAHEYNFFDRARKALRSQQVYENFLRCLLLFTNEIISSSELLCVVQPFLCRHPELQKWLQDFIGPISPPHTPTAPHSGYNNTGGTSTFLGFERSRLGSESKARVEPLAPMSNLPLSTPLRHDRPPTDTNMELDLSTCKRLGTSYCALPREAAARRCSGRTALCKEVLNDTWVSIPTWSEDSTFVTCRKTQYEEYIYRCEDERFELDVVIETNAATIRVLEGVQKKLSRMTGEEAAKYRLDDSLGGHSPTIHQRALKRIYGDKVAVDIIAGLKKNPVVAVPVVLRRLKAKEEEWREAQKGFNKQWREQNEKYYLKSLDHQGINFKQNDLKAMRSKCLINEVESIYAARRPGPHYIADYNMTNRQEAIKIVRDAAELLIHHARRQTAIQKAEKRRIKQLLRQFLPDLFAYPRLPLSDDERDDEEKEEVTSPGSPAGQNDDKILKPEKQESSESDNASDKSTRNNKIDKENKPKNNNNTETKDCPTIKRGSCNEESVKSEIKNEMEIDNDYRDHPPNEGRFVCTTSWYIFFRLHAILCSRLAGTRRAALALAEAENAGATTRPPSVAAALRLKPHNLPSEVSSPAEYYNTLLELVKGVLDGNTEASAYEDAAREMFGIKAYPAYTLDKVVSTAVRQLQHCVSESWSVRATEMAARGGMRGPLSYIYKAAKFLKQEHSVYLVKVYGGDECKVTFELLEPRGEGRNSPQLNNDGSRLSPTNQCGRENGTSAVTAAAAWSRYTERFTRPDTTARYHKPVFLRRNARKNGGEELIATSSTGLRHQPPTVRRRKPVRLHDQSECTIANPIRFVACRPHQLYRAGCLANARRSQQRLSAARRERFRAWLASTQRPT